MLSVNFGFELPGSPTIPEQIVNARQPYYDALDLADAAWKSRQLDVSGMERLMQEFLARQLTSQ